MKKMILILSFFIFGIFLYADENDFDFNDLPKDIKYCQVIGVSFALDTPPVITINFGQKWIARKVLKRGGKVFTFNNMVDVLNWMYQNGWDYSSYFILNNGIAGYWHYYLLKRRD